MGNSGVLGIFITLSDLLDSLLPMDFFHYQTVHFSLISSVIVSVPHRSLVSGNQGEINLEFSLRMT